MKFTMSFIFCLFLNTVGSFSAHAIVSPDFILSKTVKNAGQGLYQIKQDLQFSLASRTISTTETWWISSADLLFLKVEGPLFTKYFLYKNGKKYSFNSQGQFVSSALPSTFAEPFFFYRSTQDLKSALLQKKITPANSFKKRPVFKTPADLAKWSDPYLSLSRFKGAITYLLGFAAQNPSEPGIWIEQDKFLIRKIKFSKDSEVSVEAISEISKGLSYPKSKTYTWNTSSVQADLTRGEGLKTGTEFFSENEFSKLASQNKELPAEFQNTILDEFYKRFR